MKLRKVHEALSNEKIFIPNTLSCQLSAAAKPKTAAHTVTLKSSNTTAATVSKTGKVTFKKAGTVTITATSTDRGKRKTTVKLKYAP